MNRQSHTERFYAPRTVVPVAIREARVANAVSQSAEECAFEVRYRMDRWRALRTCTVLIDIDGSVYCCLRGGETLEILRSTHPQLFVGVYSRTATREDIADDVRCHMEAMLA